MPELPPTPILMVWAFFALLGLGAVGLLVAAARTLQANTERTHRTLLDAAARGTGVGVDGTARGTWYARVTSAGLIGALVPPVLPERGLLHLDAGWLSFWEEGARTPVWHVPVTQVRVKAVDMAIGRGATYPLRMTIPEVGRLMVEASLEPIRWHGEGNLGDERKAVYSRELARLLLVAGAQPL